MTEGTQLEGREGHCRLITKKSLLSGAPEQEYMLKDKDTLLVVRENE